MTRSPNHGRRRHRHPKARDLYVVDISRAASGLTVTVAGPTQPPVRFQARDDTAAIVMVDLLKQGAFNLPANGA